MSREELMQKLHDKGIETRTFFIPLHNQPVFKKFKITSKGNFKVANDIGKRGFYLPSGSGLKREEIQYICQMIKDLQKDV